MPYAVRHGGGEQKRVPLCGNGIHYEIQFVGESHVEHAVRLVQNDLLYLREIEMPSGDHVLEPAGGPDDDVDAGPEPACLLAYARSAVDGDAPVPGVPGQLVYLLAHLDRELPCGCEHQGCRLPGAGAYARENDQRVRAGLPCAGLGPGEDVLPGQPRGHRLRLDGGGLRPSHVGDTFQQLIVQT